MSGLTNFLTPYSHLIFANRDKVIVGLALVLGWAVIRLLVARWQIERLERDLTGARANQSTSPARARHMPAQLADEAPADGVLPPIKGGRSYARNLGTALQKAGIPAAGPQIYSPPVPSGWNPNTGNNQPNAMPAPMQPPTYAPQPAPWGAPPAQPPAPWAHPAGANRPPFGAQPNGPPPAPYAPQMPIGAPQNPAQPYQPQFPQAGPGQFPQPFGPPAAPAEFGRPYGDTAHAGPSLPSVAPAFTPPAPALTPPAVSASSALPPAEAPAEDSQSKEGGRRGKPKRRRFSLSVLDNLEKMVQSKPAEAPAPPQASAPIPVAVPPPAPVVAPTLFEPEQAVDETSESAAQGADGEATPESAVTTSLQAGGSAANGEDSARSEPEAAPVFEERRSNRPDMRSMLFGEEPELAAPVAAAPEVPSVEEDAPVPEEAEASAPVEETTSWSQPQPVLEIAPAEETTEPAEEAPTAEHVESPSDVVAEAPVSEEVEVAAQPEVEAVAQYDDESTSAEAEAPAAIEPDSAPAKSDAGVVVIIEDDQAAAEYYATLFRGNGYQVNVANDGVSGVDLCLKVQPQVILLDVMMPRQNGILVLQTLRASDETHNTPVVVMSNFSEPTLIKRALQLGALEYVIKTQVEGTALLNAIPRWMNREKAFAA